jgi:hypothetical protein
MDSTHTKAFGVFISPYLFTGNNQSLFHIVKGESYNTVSIGYSDGYSNSATTITGKLYLTNSISSTEFSYLSDGIQITKKDSVNANDKVIIPYGTDLTNYNKTTFRQSIINHTLINNPQINLYDKITSGEKFSTTMKTLVGNDIFPKTTNTMLTVYYTSYIKTNVPKVTNTTRKALLRYYCTNATYSAITISVINSTQTDPQLHTAIYNSDSTNYKQYVVTADTPKQVIDLTVDLGEARQGEKMVSVQFTSTNFEGDLNEYYQHCINIVCNVFILYIYNE